MAASIQLKNNLPVILIDTSYFIFYRYYSTLKWYQFRNKEINYQAIDQDGDQPVWHQTPEEGQLPHQWPPNTSKAWA